MRNQKINNHNKKKGMQSFIHNEIFNYSFGYIIDSILDML